VVYCLNFTKSSHKNVFYAIINKELFYFDFVEIEDNLYNWTHDIGGKKLCIVGNVDI